MWQPYTILYFTKSEMEKSHWTFVVSVSRLKETLVQEVSRNTKVGQSGQIVKLHFHFKGSRANLPFKLLLWVLTTSELLSFKSLETYNKIAQINFSGARWISSSLRIYHLCDCRKLYKPDCGFLTFKRGLILLE